MEIKKRVYAKHDPERFGTVMKEGPEVSEVKWDDGFPIGQFVPNEKLVETQEKKDMSVNQVKDYNDLVAKAQALGLQVQPVKKFKNSTAGEKRLAALRASIETKNEPAAPTPEAPAAGEPKEETNVAKKAKSKKSSKAKTNGANGGIRPGSKQEILHGLLTRKSGVSQAEASKALGWKTVNMGLQAKHLGVKIRREKTKDGESRYYA